MNDNNDEGNEILERKNPGSWIKRTAASEQQAVLYFSYINANFKHRSGRGILTRRGETRGLFVDAYRCIVRIEETEKEGMVAKKVEKKADFFLTDVDCAYEIFHYLRLHLRSILKKYLKNQLSQPRRFVTSQ